jgi:hypothetical protein
MVAVRVVSRVTVFPSALTAAQVTLSMPLARRVPPEALNPVTVSVPSEILPSTVFPVSQSANEQVPVTVAARPRGARGAALSGGKAKRRAPANWLSCECI